MCGEEFNETDTIEYDHMHALCFDGPDKEENFRPLHFLCHKKKTRSDVKALGKVKRLERARLALEQVESKPVKKKQLSDKWPMQKKYKRKLDGKIEKR